MKIVAWEDFDGGASGWSNNSTHEIGGLGTVLGRFSGAQDVEKTFTVPAGADGLKIKFDFIEVDSWNDEAFYVYVDGKEVNLGNFHYSSDESENTNSGTTADGIEWRYTSGEVSKRSGTVEYFRDQAHYVELWVPRSAITGSAVTLKFDARLNHGITNESYAIDNVQLTATGDKHDSTRLILEEDFESGFSSAITYPISPLGQSFGRFSGSQDRTFQYNLGEYDLEEGIQVWFKFVEMDSWNDENFTVRINGEDVSLGTYRWQIDDVSRSGSNGEGIHYSVIGSPSIAQGGRYYYPDETHRVVIQVDPGVLSGNSLALEFDATLDSDVNNESYAIDDLEIRAGTNGLTKPFHEELFNDDFDASSDGWDQTSRTSLLSLSDRQLGKFSSNVNASKTFQFDSLGTDGVTIKFKMFELNDWQFDTMIVKLNGQNVIIGDYASSVDEGERRGISGGVNWQTKSLSPPIPIDSGTGSSQLDQLHEVTLWVPRDMILDGGGALEVVLDPPTGSGGSFAIDDFTIVEGFEGFISDFSDGFVNRGSTLDVGERLYRGEALVSENGDTALFVDEDGGVRLMHDEDGSGRLESMSNLFASRLSYSDTLDYITLQADGNLTGLTADGTVIAETGTLGSGHTGHKIRVYDGELITEEADGSGIYVADHEGDRRLLQDATVPVLLDYDRHVIDAGGWSETTSATDKDWLAGFRKDPTIENWAGNHILATDTGNLTKLVKLDLIDEDKPVDFVFNIFHDISHPSYATDDSAAENVTISIGDLSDPDLPWTHQQYHSLKIAIGELTPRTFDPYADSSDAEKVEVVVSEGQLEGEYEVTIRINDLDFLPSTGNYGVHPIGGAKIDVSRWQKVHVDLGDNSGIAGLGEFKVQQYQNSESAPELLSFLSPFNHANLPTFSVDADDVALTNDLSETLKSLGNTVQDIYDLADLTNIAAFDWQIANGGTTNALTVYERVNTAMNDLAGSVGGSNSHTASLNDYVELLWEEVRTQSASEIKTAQILRDVGLGVALVSTFASLSVALAPVLMEDAALVTEEALIAGPVSGSVPGSVSGSVPAGSVSWSVSGPVDPPGASWEDLITPDFLARVEQNAGNVSSGSVSEVTFSTFAEQEDTVNAATMGSKTFAEDGFKKWGQAIIPALTFGPYTTVMAAANYISRNTDAFDGSMFGRDTISSINGVDLSTAFGHIVNGLVYSAIESGEQQLIDAAELLELNYSNLLQAVSKYELNMTVLAFAIDSLGIHKSNWNNHEREDNQIMSIKEEEGFWKSLGLTVNRSEQREDTIDGEDHFYYSKFTISSGQTELPDNVHSLSYKGYHDPFHPTDDLGNVYIYSINDFGVDIV